MKFHLLFIFGLLLSISCVKEHKPPNVLLICIDDLNDWTGFMGGHAQARTPFMDELASEAVVFKNAFCASAECNPSRAALLTGYHPLTTGFTNNFLPMKVRDWTGVDEAGDPIPGYQDGNIPDMEVAVTLPQWFREHGYYTLGCGKIFHYDKGEEHVDKNLSWIEWGEPGGNDLTGNVNRNGIYDGKVVWLDWGPEPVETGHTADHRRASWLAERIRNYDRAQPFFAAVGFKKPHDPFYAPMEFFELFPPTEEILLPEIYDNGAEDDDLSDLSYRGRLMADKKNGDLSEYEKIKGENLLGRDLRKDAVRAYLATTAFVDSCVGVVLEALNETVHHENTVVILWSDHGWHLGEKLHYHKFTHWDQALRTLLVIKSSDYKPGTTTRVVNAIDIFPTLVDLCDLPKGYLQRGFDRQGNSLVPILENPEIGWNSPSVTANLKRYHPMTFKLKGETYSDEFMSVSLRTERWKLIEYSDLEGKNPPDYELYDLLNDPEEWYNLAGDPMYHPRRKALTELLRQKPGGRAVNQQTNTPPVVVFNSPLARSTFNPGDTIEVEAGAYDMDGPLEIQKVVFLLNNEIIAEDHVYPFRCNILRPEGTCRIKLKAVDKQGAMHTAECAY